MNVLKSTKKSNFLSYLKKKRQMYILLIPGILHYLIFRYIPMGGIIVAFKDYDIYKGILKSPWIGTENFTAFISSPDFWMLIKNTVLLGTYTLLFTFPAPIIFAILLNELRFKRYKKLVQTVSIFPAMISMVVICSMAVDMLSPNKGIINAVIKFFGGNPIYFMAEPKWFRTIYVITEAWAVFGFNAIIYLSALTNVDTSLYDAASIDGCGRVKKIIHVTIPGILPMICTMFILNIGNIFKIGPDKVILLYNPITYPVADIFGSFVYRKGLVESDYSYAAAAGLFESVVAFVFVITANKLSKHFAENSLW